MCQNFYFIFLGDSSSSLWFVAGPLILLFCLRIRPQLYGFVHCFVCCGFIHCFRADSSACLQEIRLHCFLVDSSTVAYVACVACGFMTAYSVTLCEDSSSKLWIRPLIFVVVLSTVSGQIRLPCLQEIRLHCFSVDSSTVAYISLALWQLILLFCVRIRPQLYGFVHCFVCCGFIHCSGQIRLPCLQEIRLHCFYV